MLTGPDAYDSLVTEFIPALRTVGVVCVSRTWFQLVIGRDCMRRLEVNSRFE
jgi:hypothetical protein